MPSDSNNERVRELEQWQEKHRVRLRAIVEQNLPEKIASKFFEQINEQNAFLEDINQEAPPERDLYWEEQMQQRLRDLIQLHELSNKIDIFSVVCKQSTCEIAGKSQQIGIWTQVYISFFGNLAQSGEQFNPDASKNVTYLDEEEEYFYAQIVFI